MKINNLLETVLIFIFSILLLNGCRTESNIDENKNIQTNIPQKKLRLKDVPELKNILTSNPKLFNKRVKFSINDSIEVFNINSKKLNSYSVQINPDNDSAFYIVTLSYDKLKNNKVSKLIGKFVPDNNTFEKNIKNFSGKSYFETITGTPIVNSIWKNGKVIDNKNIRNAKTASCTTQSYIVANMCSEDVHWPWEGGCQASGKAYFSISTSMNCDQEMIDPNWGGGGFGDSGGGGSNSIATMSSPDAINYLLAQIGMTSLNTQQYNFLASYPIIADYFKTYFWGDNQNIDGANFMNWGINFFMQNPNTTIEQFQKWFLDGYSAQYQSNLTKLSSPQLLAFVNINKEIDASPYQEEFVKETNEMFVAFGDIDNLTEAKMIAILMLINPQYVKAMENTRMIIATYNFNRKFYPEWSKARCFWEASRESIQYMLDLGGLIPVAGEICDLTNAAIYTINGDGLNATLSYVSAIPIAGWFSTGAKFGVKVVNKTASHIASRQVLKWILGTDGIIKFGYRSQLRKVLQLTDAAKQAHHIIPWEFANNAIVQKAAKSAEAFHMNDILNGIPLPTTGHLTGHNLYNDKLNQILTNLNNSNPNMSANQAYNHILALTNQIKTLIKNNPTYNLGQIASLIKYP